MIKKCWKSKNKSLLLLQLLCSDTARRCCLDLGVKICEREAPNPFALQYYHPLNMVRTLL